MSLDGFVVAYLSFAQDNLGPRTCHRNFFADKETLVVPVAGAIFHQKNFRAKGRDFGSDKIAFQQGPPADLQVYVVCGENQFGGCFSILRQDADISQFDSWLKLKEACPTCTWPLTIPFR